MNLLQNIKWNGWSYPLENHVSNNSQSVEYLKEFSTHITTSIPDQAQRVEYLIDSISFSDNNLQYAIGLVRDIINKIQRNFEAATTTLFEFDPFKRDQKSPSWHGRQANI